MATSVITRIMKLFHGAESAHGTHGTPEKEPGGLKWNIKKTAKTLRQPVTKELWELHLKGERPLGVIPIREDNTCSWGSIDYDVYDDDLLSLIERVEASKLPLVPCISKSGGLHLFVFFDEPQPALDVQTMLKDAAASLGMADCEIFPKQSKVLGDRGDLGNWMVMPYYGDTYGGKLKMQHGLKKSGAEMTLDEFVRFCEKHVTTAMKFAEMCEKRRDQNKTSGKSGSKKRPTGGGKGDFSDGPPCLQHMTANGIQKDGRKRTLFMAALYFKRAAPDDWQRRLEEYNAKRFSPPLPAEEITGVVNSVSKKDYEYTCKEEPMRSHCDSTLCRMRKFGVGKGGEYPVISSINKLLTDPPLWFVTVETGRLELTTEELQNYVRFHKACMDRIDKVFKPIRQDAWWSILSEAMEKVEHLEAPPDIGGKAVFQGHMETFLVKRAIGRRFEDLRADKPWEDVEEGKFYFRLAALQKFLEQEKVQMRQGQVIARIWELGGGKKFFNKGEFHINAWWVPSDLFRGEKVEDPTQKRREDDV